MIQSDKTDLKQQLGETWFDIFMADNRKERNSKVGHRSLEEQSFVLEVLLDYFYQLRNDQTLSKPDKGLGWVIAITQTIGIHFVEKNYSRALEQIGSTAYEIYLESDEKGLDSKDKDEQVVRYLFSVPDLWELAKVGLTHPEEWSAIEDNPILDYVQKLSELADRWDPKKGAWRDVF
ncbi:MAG: hypothetical protein NPIRA05_01000 [Nitrospirales bacterium]|nr:MAG: hypothetical protein NPIRA05_01000 [Nitrospirales bacterium]